MAVWHRSHKSDSVDESDDNESVSLDDPDHAWWAGRDELQRAWSPRKTVPKAAERPATGAFESKYSTDSLFNWADGPDPDDPTHGGNGTLLDPYAVLGLQPGASIEEIVAAHRRLAKTYHPDRQFAANDRDRFEAEQTMSRINAAYQELRARLNA